MGRAGRARRSRRAPACRSRRASRTSPRRARCSTARPASTTPSTWSGPAAAPTSTPRSPSSVSTDPEALFDGIDETPSTRSSPPNRSNAPPLTDDELDAALGGDRRLLRPALPVLRRPRPRHGRSRPRRRRADAACPPAEARLAYRAALVHDVGRFGVPATVWDKPGPLTANEPRTDAAARLLRGADLRPARTVAPDRPAGGDAPRADGRLGLPPRRRRHDALGPAPGARRRRRVQRDDAAASRTGSR